MADYLLFGGGYSGEKVEAEYANNDTITYPWRMEFRAAGEDQPAPRDIRPINFLVLRHRSQIDGETCLVACHEAEIPENIDLIILRMRPNQAPPLAEL